MRLEASRAVDSTQPSHSSIGQMQYLSSLPRLADHPPLQTSPPASRFNFYTDPTSAFSASKRMRFSDASGGFGPFCPQRPTPLPPSFPYGTKNTYEASSCPAFYQMPHQSDSGSYGTPSQVSHNSPPITGPGSWNASGDSSGHSFAARPSGSFSSSPHFRPGGSQLSNHRTNRPHSNLGLGSRAGRYGGGSIEVEAQPLHEMI
ncbi:ribonucleoprotein RB97D-like isoform X1 [Zingiber officinale]|uniref:Uncharacterized protein n=1 Tax=Zingiber officinale TaxID=94328 RepID=A0A8J5H2Z7_ZINOF|nr:ribonucleoprotein RB97D-like isoform X1 [Zingiber officinale]KAG6515308.1 hypothetical protein ZIOFF_025700 [Zingiber officinale]